MQQLLPSLVDPPVMFAHRGARAHAPENTLEAFKLALKLGATGLESDVWMTRDGIAVLDHDGVVGRLRRRRAIGELDRRGLPDHIPSLDELLDDCGDNYHLSLDLKTPDAAGPVIDVVTSHSPGLVERLWLCHPDIDVLRGIRASHNSVRLLHSTRLARLSRGPEREAAELREAGIDGINMHHTDWTGGLTSLFHRFERVAFGWDLQFEHQLRPALRMGIDAVYSDHVDVMVSAYRAELGAP